MPKKFWPLSTGNSRNRVGHRVVGLQSARKSGPQRFSGVQTSQPNFISCMKALFYPFHLCHEQTLVRLLQDFQEVHFRDFMALQLTPLMGMTAFPDRMGDYYPEFLRNGRIVQGHQVNGPLSPAMKVLVDQDLADPFWRSLFHEALNADHRFQRGLFHVRNGESPETLRESNFTLLETFKKPSWKTSGFSVKSLQLSGQRQGSGSDDLMFDYGMALLKTSASLQYTIQLCHQHSLAAVTDSASHFSLLARICQREKIDLDNHCIKREGY